MAEKAPPPRELDRLDSLEKDDAIVHHEYAPSDPSALEGQDRKIDIDEGIDPTVLKRIMRKVDWRLVPTLAAMYCVSLIDRVNLSYARQANEMYMDVQLGTKYGDRYSIITAVFFIPYVILEIPVSCCSFEQRAASFQENGSGRAWLAEPALPCVHIPSVVA